MAPAALASPPTEDPAQVEAEAALTGFATNNLASACPDALVAYQAAVEWNIEVQDKFSQLTDDSLALTDAKLDLTGESAVRMAQLVSQLAAFLATLPGLEGSLAASGAVGRLLAPAQQATLLNAVTTAGSVATQLSEVFRSDDPHPWDHIDTTINAMSAASTVLGAKYDLAKASLGTAAAGISFTVLTAAVGLFKSLVDEVLVLRDFLRTSGSLRDGYLTAYGQYLWLLDQLKAAVDKMGRTLAACPHRTDPAQLLYLDGTALPCGWGIGIEFGDVPGATSYEISYFDALSGATATHMVTVTASAAQGDLEPLPARGRLFSSPSKSVPRVAGEHFWGLTGGNGSGPDCNYSNDPTEGGRFKDVRVVAWSHGYKLPG
jgi:hypothetical protein